MKYLFLIMITTMIFTGCAREAIYVDHEYGMATTDAFDRQVVHKDYKYANTPVEGMDGIHAETTMEAYHDSFSDSFTKENIDVSQTGSD